jgi:sodium-coupled neutral amino acid transporter 11
MLIATGIKARIYSYEDLCRIKLGKFGYYVALFCMFIFAFGAMLAYLLIIGDTITAVAQNLNIVWLMNRWIVILAISTIFILPLCMLKVKKYP